MIAEAFALTRGLIRLCVDNCARMLIILSYIVVSPILSSCLASESVTDASRTRCSTSPEHGTNAGRSKRAVRQGSVNVFAQACLRQKVVLQYRSRNAAMHSTQ